MWVVLSKEIKELLRDKKTLFFMIAVPILFFPLIIGGVTYFSSKAISEAKSKVLDFSVIGAQNAPDFVAELSNSDLFKAVKIDEGVDAESWVKNKKVDFVLVIPENFSNDLLANGQITLKVYFNDAGLNMVKSRLKKLLKTRTEESRELAFTTLQLNAEQQQALLKPFVLETINVADKREDWGEKIGGLIPYLLFILCLQGAMLPASDLGAGEKERGTLETLLISPVERNKIVLGKFFTIAIAGVTSAVITVVSMGVWGLVLGQGMAVEVVSTFMSAFSLIDFILIIFMLIPIVAIFASVLLSLSIYARSFKEAQGYMTPLVFAVIVPVILAMLPGVELKGGWAWVPLTNVALAMKELIKGTMDYLALVPIFVSTAAIAGAMLAFSIYWFKQEKVLFR